MALKRKIAKKDFDALPDAIKEHYKAEEGNADSYVLDADDADELRRAKDREKVDRTKAEQERDEVKAKLKDLEDKVRLEKLGDVATLDASWKNKYETDIKTERDNTAKVTTLAQRLALKGVADKIAAKLFTVPDVMSGRVAERLHADLNDLDDNGEPKVKVLGKDKKISALTIEDLEKEFREDKSLAKIIIGTRSSGSAPPRMPTRTLPTVPGAGDNKAVDLSKLNGKELAAHLATLKGETE